jgi:hypothetical protein
LSKLNREKLAFQRKRKREESTTRSERGQRKESES